MGHLIRKFDLIWDISGRHWDLEGAWVIQKNRMTNLGFPYLGLWELWGWVSSTWCKKLNLATWRMNIRANLPAINVESSKKCSKTNQGNKEDPQSTSKTKQIYQASVASWMCNYSISGYRSWILHVAWCVATNSHLRSFIGVCTCTGENTSNASKHMPFSN